MTRSMPVNRLILPAVVAIGVGVVVLLPGCEKPSKVVTIAEDQELKDPWPATAAQLRKETDPPSIRRTLDALNSSLAQHTDAAIRPVGLSADAEAKLGQLVQLTDAEKKEIQATTFTALDSHYLAECFYLHDVARSLDANGLPPATQARLAFEWVCRQVVNQEWMAQVSRPGDPIQVRTLLVPPTYILRRGWGAGLERAYVFLALSQQMGMDALLVGVPDADQQEPCPIFPLDTKIRPRGPIWALGVRAGKDVLLFDPWRGEAFPAAYAQVTANPDLMKPWREDKVRPWEVPPEAVKAATLYVTASLSSMAPRYQRLEKEMPGGARLFVDPVAVQGRVAKETGLPAPKFWSGPKDPLSYPRVLAAILPANEGGTATRPELLPEYQKTWYPMSALNIPPELDPGHPANELIRPVLIQLATIARAFYVGAFQPNMDVASPSQSQTAASADANSIAEFLEKASGPEKAERKRTFEYMFKRSGRTADTKMSVREQIQRGQFYEVAPDLVQKRDEFQKAAERVRTDPQREKAVRDWLTELREVYAKRLRAQERAASDPAAVQEAEQEYRAVEMKHAGTMNSVVEFEVAEPGIAEATYLLALCRHEQAEREQARAERFAADPRMAAQAAKAREKAAITWSEAVGWWQRYEPYAQSQDASFPGRADHARRLSERAAALASGQ